MAKAAITAPGIFEFMVHVRDDESALCYLKSQGLLAVNRQCKRCFRDMNLISVDVKKTKDKELFKCHKCNTTLIIRDGSIFKVSISLVLCLFYPMTKL